MGRVRSVVAILSIVALGPVATGCSHPEPRTMGPAPEPLVPLVRAEDLGTLSTSVTFLVQRCADIDSPDAAASALSDAAPQVGLEPGDPRWARAARSLTAGVSGVTPGEPCRPELSRWLLPGLAPDTIPAPAAAPTTVPLAEQAAELALGDAPLSSPEDFARLEPGQSLETVRRILGSEGVVVRESTIGIHHDQLLRWPAQGAVFATVRGQFRDGRLLAVTTSGDR